MATGINIGQQGWGQTTAATQQMLRSALGGSPARRASRSSSPRRASKTRRASPKRSKSSSKRRASATRNKLVAGSAAAKAWGRKMKALRKKRG